MAWPFRLAEASIDLTAGDDCDAPHSAARDPFHDASVALARRLQREEDSAAAAAGRTHSRQTDAALAAALQQQEGAGRKRARQTDAALAAALQRQEAAAAGRTTAAPPAPLSVAPPPSVAPSSATLLQRFGAPPSAALSSSATLFAAPQGVPQPERCGGDGGGRKSQDQSGSPDTKKKKGDGKGGKGGRGAGEAQRGPAAAQRCCSRCGAPVSAKVVGPSNPNGNAGRAYVRCGGCGFFEWDAPAPDDGLPRTVAPVLRNPEHPPSLYMYASRLLHY